MSRKWPGGVNCNEKASRLPLEKFEKLDRYIICDISGKLVFMNRMPNFQFEFLWRDASDYDIKCNLK